MFCLFFDSVVSSLLLTTNLHLCKKNSSVSSQSRVDELTIMMYVCVHYPNHAVARQSLHSTFILPKIMVLSYKPFPGLCDNDFTPVLLISLLIPLKTNPLQNCPAPAIIHRGRVCFFSLRFALKMISSFSKKLCLTHHIIELEVWMKAG